jgi:hypothetical protein
VLVAIEHEDFGAGIQGRNESEAVEGAVASAVRGCGVVETLGDIRGDAVLKRHARSEKIAAVDRQHSVSVIFAPIPEGTLAERTFPGEDAVDLGRIVDAIEIVAGDWLRLDDLRESCIDSSPGHERKLPH